MSDQPIEQFWIGSDVVCSQCGHHNVLTEGFPIVVLKRTRSQGVVSIGFACEQCQTRHIVKQDRAAFRPAVPMPSSRRGRRSRHTPSS
ncbi:MAG: hypothetical protein ACTHQE_09340 [Thermomicrobiales bacterium]|jgi:hypothetical protein